MELSASEQQELIASLIDANELYQNAPCGYFSITPDGKIIKINRTILKWLGFDEGELLGKKFISLLPKGGQMHFEMFFMPLAAVNNSVKELSYEIVRKDGSVMHVLINSASSLNRDGKLLAINTVVTDNTERKQYEKDILKAKRTAENEKRQLQFMADLVPEIIWTASARGRLEYVNARFCQYFDCNGVETRVTFILAKVHAGDRASLLKNWSQCLLSGTDLKTKVRLLNPGGVYVWHLLRAARFLDEDGKLTNWFGTCLNIDDHVGALKKKDDFISIASHELKTPITSLKAVLQLLDRLKLTPENKMIPGLIEKANRNINKVTVLVDDLLNASHINEGRLNINKTMFNLFTLIEDCVQHIRPDARFEITISGDHEVNVLADEPRIEQVVVNFISNAMKYAPDSNEIRIRISREEEAVLVEVIDQGPGIAPEKLPFLFDRYFQVDSKGSKYSGLGLGLYICAEIIKGHGGEIGAKSTPGDGSTFWFKLATNKVLDSPESTT